MTEPTPPLLCKVGMLLLCGMVAIGAAQTSAAQINPVALGTVEDFDSTPPGPFQKGFLESWRWTQEQQRRAPEWSRLEIIPSVEGKGKMLRIQIHDSQALTDPSIPVLRLAPFYPPEADALRIRLKVVSGQASIYIGGPTAYYGNSDVFTEPQTIRAQTQPQWVDVICNFNQRTWRNYRRSGFSTDSPRNYYNRWAQEPVGVFLAADSKGEFLIDRIDLVSLGEGKPFPVFKPGQIRPIQSISDFEDGKHGQAFNLYMSASEAEWFQESWTRSKPLRFEPAKLVVIEAGLDGKKSLESRGRSAEEVQCIGVRTQGSAQANAIAVTVSVDAPDQRNVLVGTGLVVPLDFLVFVAPTGRSFPWQRFAPSEELRSSGGPGFDYQFTHSVITSYSDVDFAIYQTRRYVKPGEWSKLVLPTADFTCVYGHGSMRPRFLEHQPLLASEAIAIAWLHPWCRQGRRDSVVTTRVDELTFVEVPGPPSEHRSFWQVPDVMQLQHRDEKVQGQRIHHAWLSPPVSQ